MERRRYHDQIGSWTETGLNAKTSGADGIILHADGGSYPSTMGLHYSGSVPENVVGDCTMDSPPTSVQTHIAELLGEWEAILRAAKPGEVAVLEPRTMLCFEFMSNLTGIDLEPQDPSSLLAIIAAWRRRGLRQDVADACDAASALREELDAIASRMGAPAVDDDDEGRQAMVDRMVRS